MLHLRAKWFTIRIKEVTESNLIIVFIKVTTRIVVARQGEAGWTFPSSLAFMASEIAIVRIMVAIIDIEASSTTGS